MFLQATRPYDLAQKLGIAIQDARRIVSLVHRQRLLPEKCPASIRRPAFESAQLIGRIPTLALQTVTRSQFDPFVKYLFELHDGLRIESVRIPLEKQGRYSVCVSSQVGCALGCRFCRTGQMGLQRNLEIWEIIEQVRCVRYDLADEFKNSHVRIHGVVFQGMGEPLSNTDRVIEAVRILSDPCTFAIDMRNITVCTVGIPSGIRRLAREIPQARLGWSIGHALSPKRRSLMPIDDAHSIEEVFQAVGEHTQASGHSPMWAYTLLANYNDSPCDADALADLAQRFAQMFERRPRISLIPYNSTGENDPFCRSQRLNDFRDQLIQRGVGAIIRYSGGSDVNAACGQLATTEIQRTHIPC